MEFKREEVSTGRKFTWTINNFNLVRRSEEFIKAQQFKFTAGDTINLKTKWKFYMEVNSEKAEEGVDDDQQKEWIGIFLQCTKCPEGVKEVYADFQISIFAPKENNGTAMFGNLNDGSGSLENYVGSVWGFSCVIEKDVELSDIPLIDGCLVVDIEFHLYAPSNPPALITTTFNGTGHVEAEFKRKFVEKLQSDLGKFGTGGSVYTNGQIKIISKDGVEFIGNKSILSVRSPMFETMLGTDMEEANSGVIRIAELSSKTISVLLQFINTGTLHQEWSHPEVIIQLVYAAGKYQLPDLIEFLDNVLGIVCSKEICGKLLSLANKLGMKTAETEISKWIKVNMSSTDDLHALISQGAEADIL